MNPRFYESIVPKSINIFTPSRLLSGHLFNQGVKIGAVALLDSVRRYIMIESNSYILVYETALSYPGSFQEQVMYIPRLLQETRIRLCTSLVREIVFMGIC